jgi:hypothetical protein
MIPLDSDKQWLFSIIRDLSHEEATCFRDQIAELYYAICRARRCRHSEDVAGGVAGEQGLEELRAAERDIRRNMATLDAELRRKRGE